MAKSRVEKNKKLYDELENEEFELENITPSKKSKNQKEEKSNDDFELEDITSKKEEKIVDDFELEDISSLKQEVIVKEEKKQEVVVVEKPKKNEMVVKENKKKIKVQSEEDFVVEQPLSYTSKLSAEEILRVKLEKQQELKDKKKGYKKTPNTESYTPEMMNKNINPYKGIDIRKEANIRVRRENSGVSVVLLFFLLMVVIAGGTLLIYIVW